MATLDNIPYRPVPINVGVSSAKTKTSPVYTLNVITTDLDNVNALSHSSPNGAVRTGLHFSSPIVE